MAEWYKGRTMTMEQGAAAKKKNGKRVRASKKKSRAPEASPTQTTGEAAPPADSYHGFLSRRMKAGVSMKDAAAE